MRTQIIFFLFLFFSVTTLLLFPLFFFFVFLYLNCFLLEQDNDEKGNDDKIHVLQFLAGLR